MKNKEILLGISVRKITPRQAVPLAGFSYRKNAVDKVSSDLWLKCFFFSDAERDFVFVVSDLIWWGNDIVRRIKEEVQKRWNISEDQILLHGTHTHCGPQTSEDLSADLGSPDFRYLQWLENEVFIGIEEAKRSQEKIFAKNFRGGNLDFSIHRRKKLNGQIEMKPNWEKEIDRVIQGVIFFSKKTALYKAIWILGECHPTISDLEAFSSEYPGVITREIEEKYPGAVAAFFQGACGDIRPALIEKGDFFKGNEETIDDLGKKASFSIIEAIKNGVRENSEMELEFYSWGKSIVIPLQKGKEKRCFLQRFQLTKNFNILAVNAEIVQEYRLCLNDKYPELAIWLLGYSNGMIGYLASREQILEGGYEGCSFAEYFNLESPFSIDIEEILIEEFSNLVGGWEA